MSIVKTGIPHNKLYHDLKSMGRGNFSYGGAYALMEWLDDMSEELGENIEYDPIAFCCEYSEYNDYTELANDYSGAGCPQWSEYDDDDEFHRDLQGYMENETMVIEFDGGLIIQQF